MLPRAAIIHKRRPFKSRNGCLECKKRKVKCDESPNGCGACFKRRTRCSLTPPTPPPSSLPTPTQLPSSPNQNLSTPFPVATLLDLQLLHNYVAKTCGTMATYVPLQHFYQTDFVSEALKCDYVLHCLLGLSAFHLVQQNQELLKSAAAQYQPPISSKIEDYLLAAHFHQNAGLSTFRQELTQMTPENCHKLFAASSLIVMISFAEACEDVRSITDSRLPADGQEGPTVTKWLILLRGVKDVLRHTFEWVKAGPMAPALNPRSTLGYDYEIGAVPEDATMYLDLLSSAFREHSEPEVTDACIAAIKLLRKSWAGVANGCDFGVAFYWAIFLDDAFMALLDRKTPEALLVFGAYCVLLHSENWRWWMKGWPKNMLRMVEGMIDEQWKGWLRWPAQVIADEEAGKWRPPVLVVTEGMCCQ